jgi:hypothetical protein
MPKFAEKKILLKLLDECCDHLIAVQMDYAAAKQKIAELTKSIYAPVIGAQNKYPEEGNYNAVREYVESRKSHDEPFKIYCQTHSRRELCDRLTDEFGWVVNVDSYGKNIRRH